MDTSQILKKQIFVSKIILGIITCFCLNLDCRAQRRITDFYSNEIASEYPSNLIEFNNKVYFLATDSLHGRNLWVSDGTPEGTKFFLETEEKTLLSNKLLSYKIDSALYIFSQNNLWAINKNQVSRKLNTNPLLIANNISFFDNKLFYNALEYYDISKNTFKKLSVPKSFDTDQNKMYFQECSTEQLKALSFYTNPEVRINKVYVLESNQTDYKSLELGSIFSFGIPGKMFKMNNEFFGFVSDRGIFKFSSENQPENFANFEGRIIDYTLKDGNVSFRTFFQNKIYGYTFDGKILTFNVSKEFESEYFNNIQATNKKDVFIVEFRKNDSSSKQLIKINNDGGISKKLDIKPEVATYNLKIQNDSLISFSNSYYSNYDPYRGKSAIVNTNKFTVSYIDLDDPVIINSNKILGVNLRNKQVNESISLYNYSNSTFLIPQSTRKQRPLSMGMAINTEINSLFLALNEDEKGKVIYKFGPNSDKGKLVFSQKDSTFSTVSYLNSATGPYVAEDILIYADYSTKDYTRIINVGFRPYKTNVFLYDNAKDIIIQQNLNYERVYLIDNKYFVIGTNSINEVNFANGNIIKSYNFPADLDSQRVFDFENLIYFFGKENTAFENQLFLFDFKNFSYKRIVNEQVNSLFFFKNRPVVVLKTGKVNLLDSKMNYEQYYLFSLNLGDNKIQLDFRNLIDFFTIYDGKNIYYSDGNCSNSGLVDTYFFAEVYPNINRIAGTEYYLIINGTQTSLCKGKKAQKLKISNPDVKGISKKYAYYLSYKLNENGYITDNNKADLYQLDLKTLKSKFIDSTSGNTYYYSEFKTLTPNKKWFLLLGGSQITITDQGRKTDKIEIVKNPLSEIYNYNEILLNNGNSTLLLVGSNLTLKTGDDNKIIFKPDSNERFYQRYHQIESKEFLYLAINNFESKIRKLVRVNKQTYEIKIINIPNGVRYSRTSSDGDGPYFPINVVGDRVYAIVESPDTGLQLWILDDTPQTNLDKISYFPVVSNSELNLNNNCTVGRLNQEILTEKVVNLGVFPNPTSNYLFLNITKVQKDKIKNIQVINSQGKIVLKDPVKSFFSINPDLISLDLPTFPSGIYFLQIEYSDGLENYKFVVN
jgi:ELWxxDGT repeat protein